MHSPDIPHLMLGVKNEVTETSVYEYELRPIFRLTQRGFRVCLHHPPQGHARQLIQSRTHPLLATLLAQHFTKLVHLFAKVLHSLLKKFSTDQCSG